MVLKIDLFSTSQMFNTQTCKKKSFEARFLERGKTFLRDIYYKFYFLKSNLGILDGMFV